MVPVEYSRMIYLLYRMPNQDPTKESNEEDVMSNFDFLQNEGEEEEATKDDDGDDGGNADDESDDHDDDIKERRTGKKTKPGLNLGFSKSNFVKLYRTNGAYRSAIMSNYCYCVIPDNIHNGITLLWKALDISRGSGEFNTEIFEKVEEGGST